MVDLKQGFESIRSEAELARFAKAHALARTPTGGSSCTYAGTVNGRAVELRERWWDPSSVYSAQRDKHEVVLMLDGAVVATIRFEGES